MDSTNTFFDWFICKTCKKVFPFKKLLFLHKKSHEHGEVQGKNTHKKGGKEDKSQVVKRRAVDKNNLSTVKKTNAKDEKKKKMSSSTKTLGLIRKSKENFQKLRVKKAKKNFTFTPSESTPLINDESSPLIVPEIEGTIFKAVTPTSAAKNEEIEMICLSSDSEPEMEPDEKLDSASSIIQKEACSPTAFEKLCAKFVEKEEEKSSPPFLSTTPGTSMQKVSCPICNWKLVNEKVLAIHMRIRHLDKNHLSCLFPGCKEVSQTPEDLTEHKKSHEPARPFLCPVKSCGRTFLQSNHRSLHLKNHAAETKMKRTSLKMSKSK